MNIDNHKIMTASFIVIAVSLIGINWIIFNSVDKNFEQSLNNLPKVAQKLTQASSLLPDITKNQSYKESKLRDKEIAKVSSNLNLTEKGQGYTITYLPNSKDIYISINEAKTIKEYRSSKLLAEGKLLEMGVENPCLLLIYWAAPVALEKQLNYKDTITSNCSH